jgi:predicted RND superfamily exporter protein
MKRFTDFVVSFPKTTITVILLLTFFFGFEIKNIKVDPDITSSLPKNIPAKLLYDKMNKIFPSRDMVLLAYQTDSLFSVKSIGEIFYLTKSLRKIPGVYSVMSPTNVKLIKGAEDGIEVKEILSRPPKNKAELLAFKHELFNSDVPTENLVAKDSSMAGIMIFLRNNMKPEDAAKEILNFVNKQKLSGKIFATGKPVLTLYLGRGMARDMGLLFPLVLVLIIVILWLSFGNIRGVLLPLSVVIISVTWTIGIMALSGTPISHSTNMLPILLASIAVADGIHILNHYHGKAREYPTSKEIIRNVMYELNGPVIITSVTTAFGFLALNTSRIGSVGDLGVFTSLGVMVAMFFSLAFIPAALSLMKIPKRLVLKQKDGILTRAMDAYADFLIGNHKVVLAIIIFIIVFSVAGFPRIVLENNSVDNFPKDNPGRIAYELINKKFGGTTFLSVIFEGDSSNYIKKPSVLREMDKLETYLKKQKHVGSALSLADFVKRINKSLHAEKEEYNVIPADTVTETGTEWVLENGKWKEKEIKFKVPGEKLVSQYLQLYELSGKPDDLAMMVDYDYRNARISAFIDDESSETLTRLDKNVRGYIKNNLKNEKVELTGTSELFLAINNLVVEGQFWSILVSLILVSIVTSLLFRSVMLGLMNTIPLFFAMIFNFGFMGWAGIALNIVTMLTSSIAIGVGVDYAVHYIYRQRLELQLSNTKEAVRKTLHAAGVPIIINAFTVGLGFLVLTLSSFLGVQHMGLLISIAMFTSCFGAITILPVIFLTKKNKRKN